MNAVARPRDLHLAPPAGQAPRDRGRSLTPGEVAELVFERKVSGKWVRLRAPLHLRGWFGKKLVFRERDMIEWRESLFGRETPR